MFLERFPRGTACTTTTRDTDNNSSLDVQRNVETVQNSAHKTKEHTKNIPRRVMWAKCVNSSIHTTVSQKRTSDWLA